MASVNLSTFDRLINIHQSVELNQTKRINKQILQQQFFQNAELRHLNNQLSAANEINRKILQNQIQEIERKETQKYYKSLSFKMTEFLPTIEKISNPVVKKYFVDRYFEKITTNVSSAKEILEEINDKVFCKDLLSKIENLKIMGDKYSEEFENSPFRKIDEYLKELNVEKQKIDKLKPPPFLEAKIIIKSKVNPARLIGLILLGAFNLLLLFSALGAIILGESPSTQIIGLLFGMIPFALLLYTDIKWRKSYTDYLHSKQQHERIERERKANWENQFRNEQQQRNEALKQHPTFKVYENIAICFPEFEQATIELSELEIKHFSNVPAVKRDPLFEDAARLIVLHQQVSSSLINRKLKLGNNRANKIITQLEAAGIINFTEDNKPGQVLIPDEHSLNEFLNSMRTV